MCRVLCTRTSRKYLHSRIEFPRGKNATFFDPVIIPIESQSVMFAATTSTFLTPLRLATSSSSATSRSSSRSSLRVYEKNGPTHRRVVSKTADVTRRREALGRRPEKCRNLPGVHPGRWKDCVRRVISPFRGSHYRSRETIYICGYFFMYSIYAYFSPTLYVMRCNLLFSPL